MTARMSNLIFHKSSLGPVIRKAVSANPGLKVKLDFDFSIVKVYISGLI